MEDLVDADDLVTLVQKKTGEDPLGVAAQPGSRIRTGGLRISQGADTDEPGCQLTTAHLEDGLDLDILGAAQSFGPGERLPVGLQSRPQAYAFQKFDSSTTLDVLCLLMLRALASASSSAAGSSMVA